METNQILLLNYRGHQDLECGHVDTHLLRAIPENKTSMYHFLSLRNFLMGLSEASGFHIYRVGGKIKGQRGSDDNY